MITIAPYDLKYEVRAQKGKFIKRIIPCGEKVDIKAVTVRDGSLEIVTDNITICRFDSRIEANEAGWNL